MNRVRHFCLVLLLPLCALLSSLFSVQVNAVEINGWQYDDNGYIVPDAYDDPLLRPDCIHPDCFDMFWEFYEVPSLFVNQSANLNYSVEETMSIVSQTYKVYNVNTGVVALSGNWGFGRTYSSGGNYSDGWKYEFIVSNSSGLFSQGGVLNIQFTVSAYSCYVTAVYKSGATETFNCNLTNNIEKSFEVEIPNTDADLISLKFDGGNGNTSNGGYFCLNIADYGYIVDSVADEENHSKNIFELLKGFIENFSSTISNAFKSAISVTIEGLFVPDEEFLKTKTEELQDQFWDSMGILAYPISFLKDLMWDLKDCSPEQAIFTFPRLEWEGQTLIEETEFNLYSFFYDNGFGFVIDVCRFFTSVVLVGAFLSFCQDTLRRILDDN